jgi:hypothetical protein
MAWPYPCREAGLSIALARLPTCLSKFTVFEQVLRDIARSTMRTVFQVQQTSLTHVLNLGTRLADFRLFEACVLSWVPTGNREASE